MTGQPSTASRLFRTVLKRTIAVVALVLLLLGLTTAALHLSFVRSSLWERLARYAEDEYGVSITADSFDYDLLRMRFDLSALAVRSDDRPEAPPLFGADRVSIDLDTWGLFAGEIIVEDAVVDGAAIRVEIDGSGRTNLPAFDASPDTEPEDTGSGPVDLRMLRVSGSSVVYTDAAASREVRIPAWEIVAQSEGSGADGYDIASTISSGAQLDTGNQTLNFGQIEAALVLQPDALQITTLDLGGEGFDVSATGAVSNFEAPTSNVHVAADLDLARVAADLGLEFDIGGQLLTEADITGGPDSLTVAGQASGSNLTLERFDDLTIATGFSWSRMDNRVAIENLSADTPNGSIEASGELNLAASGFSTFRVDARGLDLEGLTELFDSPVRIASRGSGEFTLRWPGSEWRRVESSGAIALEAMRAAVSRGVLPLSGMVGIESGPEGFVFDLDPLGTSSLATRGSVTLSADNQVEGNIRTAFPDTAALIGDIDRFLGNEPNPNVPYPRGRVEAELVLSGPLNDPRARFTVDAPMLEIDPLLPGLLPVALDASGAYIGGSIELDEAAIVWNGETINASGRIELGQGPPSMAIEAAGSGASIEDLLDAAGRPEIQVTGTADFDATIQGPFDALVSEVGVSARGLTVYEEPFASLDARVTLDNNGIDVADLVVAKADGPGGGTATGMGTYRWTAGAFDFTLSGEDLDVARLSIPGAERVEGLIDFRVSGDGTPSDPELSIDLTAEEASYGGVSLGQIRSGTRMDGGRIQARAEIPLFEMSASIDLATTGRFPARAQLDTRNLDLESVARLLGLGDDTLKGRIDASAEATGALLDWPDAVGHVEVRSAEASFGSQNVRAGPAMFHYDQRRVRFEPFTLAANDQELRIGGEIPIEATASGGTVGIEGTLDVAALSSLFDPSPLRVEGALAVDLELSGMVREFSTNGRLEWRDGILELPGSPDLMRPVDADIRIANNELILDQVTAYWWGSEIVAEGRLPLALVSDLFGDPASAGPANVAATVSSLGLRSVPGMPDGIDGYADILVDLEAPALTLDALRARARMRRLSLNAADIGLEQGIPVVVTYADGVTRIEPFTLVGPGTNVTGDGEIELSGERNLRIDIAGEADPAIFTTRIASMTSSGTIGLNFTLRGTLDAPAPSGNVRIEDGAFELASPPIEASSLNASIALTPAALTLESFSGILNEGEVTARGSVDYSEFPNRPAVVEIDATGRDLYIEAADGIQALVDADITARSNGDFIDVGGNVQVLEGWYTNDLDVNRLLLDSLGPDTGALGSAPNPLLARIRYNVAIDTLDSIVVENNVADVRADANLRLTGTYYEPGLVGRVFVNEGGTIELQETEFVLDPGTIDFLNANRIEPSMALSAQTSTSGYDITLQLSGGAQDLETTLTSNPPLPEPEIVALLLTGRTLDEVRGAELSIAREQALSYVTGAMGGRISRSAQRTLGLSRVSIQPNLIANESNPGARLTVGQNITRDLELIYSMNLTDSNDQIWIAEYDVRRGFVTRSIKQEDNTYRFELRQVLTFGGPDQATPTVDPRLARRIGEVQVEPATVDGRDLGGIFGLRTGARYDLVRLREARQRLRNYLADRGYLETRVRVDRDMQGTSVNLLVRVTPGPQVRFEFEGAPVSPAIADAVAAAWKSGSFDSVRSRSALEAIRNDLVRNGYLSAVAEIQVQQTETVKTVRFDILSGARYSQVEVEFPGANGLPADKLTNFLRDEGLWSALTLDPAGVQTRLAEYYRAIGYLDAAVEPPVVELDAQRGRARIRINVSEGPEYRVGGMVFSGNDSVDAEALDDAFASAGRVFRPVMLDNATDLVQQHYWDRGFNDVVIDRSLVTHPETGTVDFSFAIQENAQDVVGEIEIAGNVKTGNDLVRTQITLESGQPLSTGALTNARRNLYNTGAYSLVDIETVDLRPDDGLEPERAGQTPVRVRFNLREVPPYSLRYGGFYDTEHGIGGIVDIRNQNSLGRARTLGLRARYDSQLRESRIYFSQPSLLRVPLRSNAGVFVRKELETAFISDSVGFSLEQEARLSEHYLLSYGYSFEHSRTYDRLEDGSRALDVAPEVVNVAPLSATLSRDTRDDILDASRGVFMSHSLEYAPKSLGSDDGLIRYFGQFFRYRPISEPSEIPYSGGIRKSRFLYAGGVRLGLAAGLDGSAVPLSKRFFAGGGTTIRGFDQDLVGPRDPEQALPTPLGGGAVLILNNELRFPIFNIFDGVAFLDAGNVYRNIRDFDLGRLRSSAGFGLRIRTPYFLLRADYGFNLNRRPGETRGTFFFSIGQAF